MQKIYLTDIQGLAFFNQKATPEFWDEHWQSDCLAKMIRSSKTDDLFIPAVLRYLKKGSLVLEGGCGRALLVHALQYNGYKALGIDFAGKTVEAINNAVPEIDVRIGDVRKLEIHDSALDGYISVGVIEHFWEGYDQIIREMYRTLRPGGHLFLSFPHMSPFRKLKVLFGIYPKKQKAELKEMTGSFYQFALEDRKVLNFLTKTGFELVESMPFGGIKGFKDECFLFRKYLQDVFDGKKGRARRDSLEKRLNGFASHCILMVLKKKDQ